MSEYFCLIQHGEQHRPNLVLIEPCRLSSTFLVVEILVVVHLDLGNLVEESHRNLLVVLIEQLAYYNRQFKMQDRTSTTWKAWRWSTRETTSKRRSSKSSRSLYHNQLLPPYFLSMSQHTANPTALPRPAGLAIPVPAAKVLVAPPGALAPNLLEASAGGGDSTDNEMICAPRTIVKPSVRFSSASTTGGADAPGAVDLACFLLTRLNSSVSAKTRFMCCKNVRVEQLQVTIDLTLSKASICPTI